MDVLLLSPGKHMFDEAFSLSCLGVGHKYFAHSVGYFWLLPRCAFSLSVKSWKEARAELKLVLLSREKKKRNTKKGKIFTMVLTAYLEAQEEVGVPGEILFGGFAGFFSSLGS